MKHKFYHYKEVETVFIVEAESEEEAEQKLEDSLYGESRKYNVTIKDSRVVDVTVQYEGVEK